MGLVDLHSHVLAAIERFGEIILEGGGFTFMPSPGACGAASFRYTATDGTNSSNEATVSIVIDCLPRAGDDTAGEPVVDDDLVPLGPGDEPPCDRDVATTSARERGVSDDQRLS